MKKVLMLLWIVLFPLVAAAQEAAGVWSGTLAVGEAKLRLVFHLNQTAEGWQATMDSPDQGARGIPVDSVAVTPHGVTLAIKPLQMRYTAGFMGSNLVGMLTQHGRSCSLMLTRGEVARPNRPQEPVAPFPYRTEEVAFAGRDGAVTLHGTLTLPTGEGRYPALVLVTGSGTQNRDEELFDHKPFLVLADRLTRAGYAVLRYDDRGYNAPKEELERLKGTTTADLVQDALGAFDLLRNHPAINPDAIGIGGHSEGGTIALMAAAEEPAVDFVVSLAGMVVKGTELMIKQTHTALLQSGISEPMADAYAEAQQRLYADYLSLTPEEFLTRKGERIAQAASGLSLPQPLLTNLDKAITATAGSAWLDHFVRLDPSDAVRRLNGRPCLAVNGTKDVQVDATMNLNRLAELTAGATNVTTYACEGLNHLFQPCTTGVVTEYGQIETTIDESLLTLLLDWLKGLD